jgi:uncharacterized membrane protein
MLMGGGSCGQPQIERRVVHERVSHHHGRGRARLLVMLMLMLMLMVGGRRYAAIDQDEKK